MGYMDDPVDSDMTPVQAAKLPFNAAQAKDNADYLKNLQASADAAQSMAGSAAQFMGANQGTNTGGILALPFADKIAAASPQAAALMGIQNPQNISAMNRAATQMAAALKPQGARLSNFEFGKFLGASPSVGAGYASNERNAQDIYAANTLAQAQRSFYQSWAKRTNGDLSGAGDAWLGFRNSHFSPDGRTYYHNGDALNGGNAQPASPNTVVRAHQRAGQVAQQAAQVAPAGAVYDVNGRQIGQ